MATKPKDRDELIQTVVDQLVANLHADPSSLNDLMPTKKKHWPDLKEALKVGIERYAHRYGGPHIWAYRPVCNCMYEYLYYRADPKCKECHGVGSCMFCRRKDCTATRPVEVTSPNTVVTSKTRLVLTYDFLLEVVGRDFILRVRRPGKSSYNVRRGIFTPLDVVPGWSATVYEVYEDVFASCGEDGTIEVTMSRGGWRGTGSDSSEWEEPPVESNVKRYPSLEAWLKASGLKPLF